MLSTMKIAILIYTYIPGWWFGICLIFAYIGNLIIPTDDLSIIFQRGRWLNHQVTISREAWDRSLVPSGGEPLQICELEIILFNR